MISVVECDLEMFSVYSSMMLTLRLGDRIVDMFVLKLADCVVRMFVAGLGNCVVGDIGVYPLMVKMAVLISSAFSSLYATVLSPWS